MAPITDTRNYLRSWVRGFNSTPNLSLSPNTCSGGQVFLKTLVELDDSSKSKGHGL
jgi:hypothetical protein